jgi:hypothetical protein
MSDLQGVFASLPPASSGPDDTAVAHRIWLRAHIAAIGDEQAARARTLQRLRVLHDVLTVAALDVIAPAAAAAAGARFVVALAAAVVTHTIASLALLRAQ